MTWIEHSKRIKTIFVKLLIYPIADYNELYVINIWTLPVNRDHMNLPVLADN